jgi:hypothetical protein
MNRSIVKKIVLLSSVTFLNLVSIALNTKLVIAGCGWLDITCPSPENTAETPGFPSKPRSNKLGFYKQQDRPEVSLAYRSTFYCHVQNEEQMGAFGGFDKVKVSSSLNLVGKNTGDCGWPNGFFRRSNQPEVYRMYGGGIPEFNIGDSFCHVANEAQMNAFGGFGQVRVVPPSSDLGRGRNFTGDCSNS